MVISSTNNKNKSKFCFCQQFQLILHLIVLLCLVHWYSFERQKKVCLLLESSGTTLYGFLTYLLYQLKKACFTGIYWVIMWLFSFILSHELHGFVILVIPNHPSILGINLTWSRVVWTIPVFDLQLFNLEFFKLKDSYFIMLCWFLQ